MLKVKQILKLLKNNIQCNILTLNKVPALLNTDH